MSSSQMPQANYYPRWKPFFGGQRFVSSSLAGHDLISPEVELQAEREKVVSHFRRQSVESNRHALRLYSDDAAFVDDFAHSIEAALESGKAVQVVATESHRPNLLERLRAHAVDVESASERKLYTSIELADTLL